MTPLIPTMTPTIMCASGLAVGVMALFMEYRYRLETEAEMEREIQMNQQHIHELEEEKRLLEETIEHLSAGSTPTFPTDTFEDALLSCLRKTRGKTAQDIRKEMSAMYPDADRHALNSRLYSLLRRGVVAKRGRANETPRWVVV